MTATIPQINLLNPLLLPKREILSARSVLLWVVIAVFAMAAVAWWAVTETRNVQRQANAQAAQRAINRINSTGPDFVDVAAVPTPPQMAALEQNLRAQQATLEARRAALTALKRVMGSENGGPSETLRALASSIPDAVWITELRVTAGRLEMAGKSLDPAAVNAWLNRLTNDGYLSAKPAPAVRVENTEPPAAAAAPAAAAGTATRARVPEYSFVILATLARPFAEDAAGRTP